MNTYAGYEVQFDEKRDDIAWDWMNPTHLPISTNGSHF